MNVKALLDTDVSTLFRGVQQLWTWWTGELQALLPSTWRPSASAKTRLVAELKDGKLLFREYRRGNAVPVPRLGPPERLLAKAFFALPPDAVLARDVSFPPLPMADLRRMAGLDMDRLTPFRNEDVVFDLDIRPGHVEGKMRQVTVAVVRRKILDDILAKLWSFGAEPTAIGMIDRHGGTPRFDFLTAAEIPGRRPLLGLQPSYWWLAVVFLFVGNIGLLVAKDAYSVANLRNVVEA
ncbi:MAG TPA: hypothetical protein VFQ52_09155, partial [Rhizomicrobium sp.]|nr:hypothetical protein [Rhizomicrobium sp.]